MDVDVDEPQDHQKLSAEPLHAFELRQGRSK